VPAYRRLRQGAGAHAPLCAGDEAALTSLLARLAAGQEDAADVMAYGQWLYECLLAPSWQDISTRAEVQAARGVEVALRWPADEQDLHGLVWEAMHNGRVPLAGDPDLLVAITRVVPARVPPPVPTGSELRLLLAAGTDLADDLIREGALFMGLLRGVEAAGPCTVRMAQSLTIGGLAEECAQFRPHIVHLVARGGRDGSRHAVQLASDRGGGVAGIGALLRALTHGHRPMAVLLSVCRDDGSCDSAATIPLATELVTGGIAIVVAVTGEISEPACRLYTRLLVNAVSEGGPVVAAAAQGRRAALIPPAPRSSLEWARPALFLADSVRPGFQLVDLPPRRRVTILAQTLDIRTKPLFIGRSNILAAADRLLTADGNGPGFIGIVHDGPIEQLGATRLLQEIASRLLARGHIPLFLGPYRAADSPASLSALAADILSATARFAAALGLGPAASRVLGSGDPAADWTAAAGAIRVFRRGADELDPRRAWESLRADLDQLASAAGATGAPFGPHSRPVVLGDSAHTWVGALETLLPQIGSCGLGRPSAPIPVVLTASMREGVGPVLRAFIDVQGGRPTVVIRDLEPMSAAEAAIGYQWLLLHPGQHGEPAYLPTRGAQPEELRKKAFALLQGRPAALSTDLYLLARLLAENGALVAEDDELLVGAGWSR